MDSNKDRVVKGEQAKKGSNQKKRKNKVEDFDEEEFSWRREDAKEDNDQHQEISDQAGVSAAIPSFYRSQQQEEERNKHELGNDYFYKDEETSATFQEIFGPSAATNLAWKSSLEKQKPDIRSSGWGTHKDSMNNDHSTLGKRRWDEPVKKYSSFLSQGQNDGGGSFSLSRGNSRQLENSDKIAASSSAPTRHNVCSPQDYEILKVRGLSYDINLDFFFLLLAM